MKAVVQIGSSTLRSEWATILSVWAPAGAANSRARQASALQYRRKSCIILAFPCINDAEPQLHTGCHGRPKE